MTEHKFTVLHLFSGVGGGALGTMASSARVGAHVAKFELLGGVDIDHLSCVDFRNLTGAPCLEADLHTMSPAELLRLCPKMPDAVVLSPPCKGFSRLLNAERAAEPKYQLLNRLLLDGLFLLCSTWESPPPIIFVENVPGIMSRGGKILDQVHAILHEHGLVWHEGTHNCGNIGHLAQSRPRWFLMARCPKRVPQFIYQPKDLGMRPCGDVIGPMPMPGDPAAGTMHELPKISWRTWVRLAMIPAGGDWRDLPGVVPAGKQRREVHRRDKVVDWQQTCDAVVGPGGGAVNNVADPRVKEMGFGGAGVNDWEKPTGVVASESLPNNGKFSVADPRVAAALGRTTTGETFKGSPGLMGVDDWEKPAPTVTGGMSATGSNTPAAVADPRPFNDGRFHGSLKVLPLDEPTGAVTSGNSPSAGAPSVADPRPFAKGDKFNNALRVSPFDEPAGCVTGSPSPTGGALVVADPRPFSDEKRPFDNRMQVELWDKPVHTVTGASRTGSGALSIADPRGADWRNGTLRVLSWQAAAATITGSLSLDNGPAAIADPRFPDLPYITDLEEFRHLDPDKPPPFTPLIIAADGTWHRPLTTLELAALQSFPIKIDGKPLVLAQGPKVRPGMGHTRWREAIGNAIPPDSLASVGNQILHALLMSALGMFALAGGGAIWVEPAEPEEAA